MAAAESMHASVAKQLGVTEQQAKAIYEGVLQELEGVYDKNRTDVDLIEKHFQTMRPFMDGEDVIIGRILDAVGLDVQGVRAADSFVISSQIQTCHSLELAHILALP